AVGGGPVAGGESSGVARDGSRPARLGDRRTGGGNRWTSMEGVFRRKAGDGAACQVYPCRWRAPRMAVQPLTSLRHHTVIQASSQRKTSPVVWHKTFNTFG